MLPRDLGGADGATALTRVEVGIASCAEAGVTFDSRPICQHLTTSRSLHTAH